MAIISVAYARIAFQLWGGKPPGEAQEDRDHNILANKKKVSTDLQVIPYAYQLFYRRTGLCLKNIYRAAGPLVFVSFSLLREFP